jgi:NAD(P)H-dependent FMN reductase
MLKLQIIVGSTRPTRAADLVIPWVLDRTSQHDAFEPELLDLRDWPLPIFGEHSGTIGDFSDPTYSDPLVRAWNKKLAEGDAYLVITPEYNRSLPGVLKNAIDSVFLSFALRNKPLGTVAYSVGTTGGARAAEHLALIAIENEMAPMRNLLAIPQVGAALAEAPGAELDARLTVLLDDLAWWGDALQRARAAGELSPGSLRIRAATAA